MYFIGATRPYCKLCVRFEKFSLFPCLRQFGL